MVFAPADLAGYAAGLCAEAGADRQVTYVGDIGTRRGWEPMPVADVCAAIAPEGAEMSIAPEGGEMSIAPEGGEMSVAPGARQ
jgi:hypothetical protein